MTSHAASSDRLSHARKAVADAGLGALLVTKCPSKFTEDKKKS